MIRIRSRKPIDVVLAGVVSCGLPFCVQLAAPRTVVAQSNTGSIVGQVFDPVGKRVAGATVVLRNTDLSARRTVISDGSGTFRFDGLVPGAVTVEGKSPGPSTKGPVRLTLGLGSTVHVLVKLAIPSVAQRATVSARGGTSEGNTLAPPVNRDEATVSSFFTGSMTTYLPNRDRDFTQFGQLGAGVSEDANGNGVIIAGHQSSAHSDYDGLLLTANWQISRRSQVLVYDTISQTHDDDSSSGSYGIDATQSPYSLASERAASAQDIRNVLNLSTIFNLPLGFKCNPVFLTRTGRPYTPIIGLDTQHDANDWNGRAVINGSTAGRNSLRQPDFYNVDVRFVKDFSLRGVGHHLDLFLDVFNLTEAWNHNFGRDAVSLYGTNVAPVASAEQALFEPDGTRFGGTRAIQFTARLLAF